MTGHRERLDLAQEFLEQLNGPKFCENCNKTQPIQRFEQAKSGRFETETFDDKTILTYKYVGAVICNVCKKRIEV